MSLIARTSHTSSPLYLLTVETEKAFDRVQWEFLEGALHKIDLGPDMREWFMALYNNPTAQVRVKDPPLLPFKLGTSQGCSLYPCFVYPAYGLVAKCVC